MARTVRVFVAKPLSLIQEISAPSGDGDARRARRLTQATHIQNHEHTAQQLSPAGLTSDCHH